MQSAARWVAPWSAKWPGYVPRRPQDTVLYQVVQRWLEPFIERTQATGNLPRFVLRELQDYLRCGRLQWGFAQCLCLKCGRTELVPLSCQHRGFCPSCLGRRMNDLSIGLADHVIPAVPLRQFVFTVPFGLRYRLGYDPRAFGLLMRTFTRALSVLLRHRAKEHLGLGSVREAMVGSVSFVHRGDSALRLNPHVHTVCLDGVYLQGPAEQLRFVPLPAPSVEHLGFVVQTTAQRVLRQLDLPEVGAEDPWCIDEPLLAQCYAAAVQGRDVFGPRKGQPSVRLVDTSAIDARAGGPAAAEHEGFRLYADGGFDGRDRQRLFHLCRYLARPPVAQSRLKWLGTDRLRYTLKRPWSDGTSAIVLHPLDLLARLCSLVPAPPFAWLAMRTRRQSHLLRFAGVLAGHAKARAKIVAEVAELGSRHHSGPSCPAQLVLPLGTGEHDGHEASTSGEHDGHEASTFTEPSPRRPARTSWSRLLARVFRIDVSVCPDPSCRGRMKIVRFVTRPDEIEALLDGMPRAPPLPPRSRKPMTVGFGLFQQQLELPFPS